MESENEEKMKRRWREDEEDKMTVKLHVNIRNSSK